LEQGRVSVVPSTLVTTDIAPKPLAVVSSRREEMMGDRRGKFPWTVSKVTEIMLE